MRICKKSGMLSLSVSELDAANDVGVSLRALFRNETFAWRKVSDALDRRRINRESVGIRSFDRTARQLSVSERAAEAAERAELLARVNRPVLAAIEANDQRISAETALLRAVLAADTTTTDSGIAA